MAFRLVSDFILKKRVNLMLYRKATLERSAVLYAGFEVGHPRGLGRLDQTFDQEFSACASKPGAA